MNIRIFEIDQNLANFTCRANTHFPRRLCFEFYVFGSIYVVKSLGLRKLKMLRQSIVGCDGILLPNIAEIQNAPISHNTLSAENSSWTLRERIASRKHIHTLHQKCHKYERQGKIKILKISRISFRIFISHIMRVYLPNMPNLLNFSIYT